ncbi:NADH-quinone oxidoreductase subunit H, partial [uncultured Actinomyces sp.]
VEYSSMKFAWYFLAEYINMFNVSAVCVTLFLGGWHPFILTLFWDGAGSGWWPVLWFVIKVWAVMFFMIWTRGTLVRIRYDHFMKLGWKVLIPVSLAWFVLVVVVQGFRAFLSGSPRALLLALALVFLIAMLVLFFLPEPEGEDSSAPSGDGVTAPGEELDAFAGGYPVPPMPGQELPVSPRARRTRKAAEPARVDAASSIADAVTGSLAETVAGSVAISPPPSDSGSGDTAQEGTDD